MRVVWNNGDADASYPDADTDVDAVDFDVVVIGGGVVGLAVAQAFCMRSRARVLLLEREDAFAEGATSGSSGLGCTGYDAPPGSLERQLMRRAIRLHLALYRSFGLSYEHNREAGDGEARFLDREELRLTEPALSREALGAVLCPREAVAEPWLVPICYAASAAANGATLRLATEVTGVRFVGGLWRLTIRRSGVSSVGRSVRGEVLGQGIVFQLPTGTLAPDFIIEPVASQHTKGIIVWRTLYGNIVVGPTAEDQSSRSDRSTDMHTVGRLRQCGERVLPALRGARLLGSYSGLRPATQHRDYQLSSHPSRQIVTVGGIRSTGLTASAAIAEHVVSLCAQFPSPVVRRLQVRVSDEQAGLVRGEPDSTEGRTEGVSHQPRYSCTSMAVRM
ncbi:FAD dependent oxidoreductase-domain-containing protein [Ochromonadaceae sp. CCMP2298]|nr:FAD dependent oxidoreductase-domain-containing protein [Ochromonadaceae sp. CCMP2298]